MAANNALPELVTCMMVKFWKGAGSARRSMEYTPNPAATRTTRATIAPAVTPTLCFFAAATAELLVVCPEVVPEAGAELSAESLAMAAVLMADDADPDPG